VEEKVTAGLRAAFQLAAMPLMGLWEVMRVQALGGVVPVRARVAESTTTSLLLRDVEGGASLLVEKDARESWSAFVPVHDKDTDEERPGIGSLYRVEEVCATVLRVPVKDLRAADAKTDATFVATFAGKAVATAEGADVRYDVYDGGVNGVVSLGDVLLACDPAQHAKCVDEAVARCADALAPCDERERMDTSGWVGEGDEEAAEEAEREAEREAELARVAVEAKAKVDADRKVKADREAADAEMYAAQEIAGKRGVRGILRKRKASQCVTPDDVLTVWRNEVFTDFGSGPVSVGTVDALKEVPHGPWHPEVRVVRPDIDPVVHVRWYRCHGYAGTAWRRASASSC
jgi:hypothetical protein